MRRVCSFLNYQETLFEKVIIEFLESLKEWIFQTSKETKNSKWNIIKYERIIINVDIF